MNSGIYKITHKETSRVYVGQSVNLKQRLYTHKNSKWNSKRVSIVANAIRKYGVDAFIFEVLVYATGKEYMNLLEQKIIAGYNSITPNGFNIREGGNSSNISESTRLKMSKVREQGIKNGTIIHPRGMTGKKASKETKEKMRLSKQGKDRGEEFKQKMKKVAIKRWQDPEYKAKVLAAKGIL